MSVTTRNQGKAQAIARKLMTGWDVGDLENLMTEHISDEQRRKLLSQIDPQYDAIEAEASKIYTDLYKQLKQKTEKEALGRYSEIHLEMSTTEGQAGFHLGFAAALELLGVDGRGLAERKAQHMKGGRA
jgi:hypothetical protein